MSTVLNYDFVIDLVQGMLWVWDKLLDR